MMQSLCSCMPYQFTRFSCRMHVFFHPPVETSFEQVGKSFPKPHRLNRLSAPGFVFILPHVTSNVISAYPSAPFRIAVTVTTSPVLYLPSCSWYRLIVSTLCSRAFYNHIAFFHARHHCRRIVCDAADENAFEMPLLSESSSVIIPVRGCRYTRGSCCW